MDRVEAYNDRMAAALIQQKAQSDTKRKKQPLHGVKHSESGMKSGGKKLSNTCKIMIKNDYLKVKNKASQGNSSKKTGAKVPDKAKGHSSHGKKKSRTVNNTFDSDSDDDSVRYSLSVDLKSKMEAKSGNQKKGSKNGKKTNTSSASLKQQMEKAKKTAYEPKSEEQRIYDIINKSAKYAKKSPEKVLRSGKSILNGRVCKKLKLEDGEAGHESKPVIGQTGTIADHMVIDPEISFKSTSSVSSGSPKRRISLLDSWRGKNGIKQEPITPYGTPPQGSGRLTPRLPTPIHPGSGASLYRTPPTSPRIARSRSNTPTSFRPVSPGSAQTHHFLSDFPKIPVIPVFSSSPSTASYKAFLASLPKKFSNNRSLKKRCVDSDSDSDSEEGVGDVRRLSVRQSECAYKYKEIVVKKCSGYTQIWLFTNTPARNALNPQVFEELKQALYNAKFDDSGLVMLSGSGNIFSSGVDLPYLLTNDKRISARKMAEAIREFINAMVAFPKPIVAAVNGPAVGLGMAILPLCDIVYASDKASFYAPYGRLAQTPEGCSSFTFPNVMGTAMANELLLAGRKLTAIEAYQIGLVSQVFWPTSMMQEVIPRVENMATYSAKALEASKLLIHSHRRAKLEYTNESECNMLQERWSSPECQKAMRAYLEDEQDLLF
ncbi:chromodomain Y-like protein 2 isoform X2 [Lingula anatina]|nr:chromodomain Y-like protein 2 isoform X2 [Lingula anatina]|eukprot:XP_013404823.1 chromodomain Y-like protein 2 isoform X2 [Lingula anatina]